MKKYSILFVTALAGLSILSCNREANVNDFPKDEVIHFTATAEGTKTVVAEGEEHVNWSATDQLAIVETLSYTGGDPEGPKVNTGSAVIATLSGDKKTADFNASVSGNIPDGATLTGASYVAANPNGALSQGGSGDNKFWRMMMPALQQPVVGSFDPAADLLLSAPVNQAARVAEGDKIAFRFHRLGTAVKMVVKGLPAGEKLQRITLTAPVNVAGYLKVDLTNAGYVSDAKPYNSQSKTLTLDFNEWEITDSDIDVWFRVTADTWSETLKISAETDQAYYYRDGTNGSSAIALPAPMEFADGGRTRFPVSLAPTSVAGGSAIRVAKDPSKVLADGSYLILAKNGDNYYAMKAETVSSNTRMASVAYTGALDAYYGDADMIWELTKSGSSYIVANDGKYLGYKGGDNKAFWEEPGEEWTTANYLLNIAWDPTNSCYHAVCNGFSGRYLSRTSSNDWFAFYTTEQQRDLFFVPATVDSRTAVTLSFAEDTFNLTSADCGNFLGQDVTADPNVAAITEHIEWSYVDTDGIFADFDQGVLMLNGNFGTATVTASFAGDAAYRPAEASYTINVTSGVIDYSTLGTSNVTLSTDGGTSASTAKVKKYGESTEYDALKAGIGSAAGAVKITVPAGTTNLHLHAAGWNNETVTVQIADKSVDPEEVYASLSLTSNSGISGSSPFTLSDGVSFADFYFNVELTGITADTELIFTATSGKRFVIWGVNAVADTRADAEISWSASAKTVTYSTGNTNDFSPYSFNNPHNVEVTYASTDETIASIDATTGVITMTALSGNAVKEGSTTIQAIFAGSTDYRPTTAGYTLTVVDGRDAVATPTFDPAAGEVAANTVVNFQCTTGEVTFHYTVDGSAPTVESPAAESVTIDVAKTVKVLAAKDGYRNSNVASADYTVAGAYETLPFEETFASSKGSFLIDDVSNPDNLSYIWNAASGYMKATSYVSSANHNAESWLVSPLIQIPSLASGESAKLKFEHCINKYFGTVSDEATLWVKAEGGSWTKINISYPAVSGTWSSFEQEIIDLSAYAGEKIQFAFKYVGTSTTAGTWEVKNVSLKKYEPLALSSISVSGQKQNFKVGDSFSFGGTVTAHYNDDSTADVTASASFTGYDMSTAGEQTVTVSYTEGTTKTTTYNITVSNSAGPSTYVSTFTSASWASTGDFGWTSGKAGAGFNNNGIQVTSNATGANATTNKTFTNVSQVVVTYNTNKSAGAGTLDLKVGTNAVHSENWSWVSGDGRTANYTCTFTINPAESGAIKLTANTTTNSIYIVSVTVTATAME